MSVGGTQRKGGRKKIYILCYLLNFRYYSALKNPQSMKIPFLVRSEGYLRQIFPLGAQLKTLGFGNSYPLSELLLHYTPSSMAFSPGLWDNTGVWPTPEDKLLQDLPSGRP